MVLASLGRLLHSNRQQVHTGQYHSLIHWEKSLNDINLDFESMDDINYEEIQVFNIEKGLSIVIRMRSV